ncbi:MAG: enoyl-CoA hydratase/isomerase family protein [Beutenbergiaceae bacterium]
MNAPAEEAVTVDISATRALVQWHRPSKRNAFSVTMLRELEQQLGTVTAEHPNLPIILTGGSYFSAGADAAEMATDPRSYADGIGRLHVSIGDQITRHPAPVIAAIEGFALGGALVIAANADFIYAGSDALLALTEAQVGLVGGLGVIDRVVGRLAATNLVLLGERISSDEAVRLGLITAAVPPGTALATAEQTAAALAERNPDAWTRAKEILRADSATDKRELEIAANAHLMQHSPFTREHLARFQGRK